MTEFWTVALPAAGSLGSVIATVLGGYWVSRRLNRANADKAGHEGGKAAAEGEVAYSADAREWRKQAMAEVAEAKAAAAAAEAKADAAEEASERCASELRRLSDAIYGCAGGASCPVLERLTRS